MAGFDDVWWSDAGPGWTNATDRPVASNLVARQWTEIWEQNSTTNTIPPISWDNRYAYYLFSSWVPYRSANETATGILYPNSGSSWNGDIFITQLSHYPPIGATNTSSRTWTNVVTEYPRPDLSAAAKTRYLLESDALTSMDSYAGGQATYQYVWTNSSLSVTTDLTVVVQPITNALYMSTADAVAYDSYRAIAERWAVWQGDRDTDRSTISDAYKPAMGRRGQTRNLDKAKNFLAYLLPFYVDPYLDSDFTQAFGTNYAGLLDWSDFAPTATGLCADLSIPTNYFDYTPPQLYSLPASHDLGRVVTNTYTMVCTGTNACTNSVLDFEHDTRDVIGTNGQVVTFLSTNENVLAGYTLKDYGYKNLPALITNGLIWVGDSWSEDSAREYLYVWFGDPTWEGAKTNGARGAGSTPGNYSYGSLEVGGYSARWHSSEYTISGAPAAIGADVDFYLFADTEPIGTEPFAWNDDTYTNLVESRMALVETTSTTSNVVTVIVGSTNQPTWCDEPTGTGTNGTGLGARIRVGVNDRRVLYRYGTTNFNNE